MNAVTGVKSARGVLAMAVAKQSSHDCVYCDATYTMGYRGSYCSESCYYADEGEDVYEHLKSDHRICATCLKPTKVVFRPNDNECPELRKKALIIREAFIGFQDLTEYAEMGNYGTECQCGNVDHYNTNGTIRKRESYPWFLMLALEQFRQEGQLEHTFDLPRFLNAEWDSGSFVEALGRALHE